SLITVTPGMAEAARHEPVWTQSGSTPSGLMKTTNAVGRFGARAISSASSVRLARVQSHLGCAIITIVGPARSRARRLSAGQVSGALAARPGRLSYAISAASPAAMPPSHRTPTAVHTSGARTLIRIDD